MRGVLGPGGRSRGRARGRRWPGRWGSRSPGAPGRASARPSRRGGAQVGVLAAPAGEDAGRAWARRSRTSSWRRSSRSRPSRLSTRACLGSACRARWRAQASSVSPCRCPIARLLGPGPSSPTRVPGPPRSRVAASSPAGLRARPRSTACAPDPIRGVGDPGRAPGRAWSSRMAGASRAPPSLRGPWRAKRRAPGRGRPRGRPGSAARPGRGRDGRRLPGPCGPLAAAAAPEGEALFPAEAAALLAARHEALALEHPADAAGAQAPPLGGGLAPPRAGLGAAGRALAPRGLGLAACQATRPALRELVPRHRARRRRPPQGRRRPLLPEPGPSAPRRRASGRPAAAVGRASPASRPLRRRASLAIVLGPMADDGSPCIPPCSAFRLHSVVSRTPRRRQTSATGRTPLLLGQDRDDLRLGEPRRAYCPSPSATDSRFSRGTSRGAGQNLPAVMAEIRERHAAGKRVEVWFQML